MNASVGSFAKTFLFFEVCDVVKKQDYRLLQVSAGDRWTAEEALEGDWFDG